MTRTISSRRARESSPAPQCLGCGDLFYASRSDQRYCSEPCRSRNRSAYNNRVWPSSSAREVPLTTKMMMLRESLYRVAHVGCVGYRLYSRLLDWWFPLQGRTLRSTGHFSDAPYYSLVRPFEQPMVPIEDTYEVQFVERAGNPVVTISDTRVTVETAVELRNVHPQLAERIKLYQRERSFIKAGPALPASKTRGLLGR